MATDVNYRRLSVDGTLNAGLSILGVTFLIGILVGLFVIAAFMSKETVSVYVCANGEIIESAEGLEEDGIDDCEDGSDEYWPTGSVDGKFVESSEFGFISYMMFGCSGIFLVAGILGLSTKILADSISAGLALHAANENSKSNVGVVAIPAPLPQSIPVPVHPQQLDPPQTSGGAPMPAPHSIPPPR